MKRLGLWGLVVLAWACGGEPPDTGAPEPTEVRPPPPQVQGCLVQEAEPAPPPQAASAERAGPDAEGRQPVLVRLRPPEEGRTSAQALVAQEARTAQVLTRSGGRLTRSWPRLGVAAARVSPVEAARLREDPDVLSVEPDREVHALELTPPLAAVPPALAPAAVPGQDAQGGGPEEASPHLRMVQAPAVWDPDGDGTPNPGVPAGAGVKVCVVDSGIDSAHPELARPFQGGQDGRDFVDGDAYPWDQDALGKKGVGHGTHVAGILAAQPGSAALVPPDLPAGGVVGAAPDVTLLVARVLDTRGSGLTSDIIEALEWCRQRGAHIVSLSLGSPEFNQAEADAFAAAWKAGMLTIAAAGNSGVEDPAREQPRSYPAGYEHVVAVGAVDLDGTHPSFSQTGPHLSLVAPGVDVPSTVLRGSALVAGVEAQGQSVHARPLEFSAQGEYVGTLIDCGKALDATSCGRAATCGGFVALVQRGDISFAQKVRSVQQQGARAVIVVNNVAGDGGGTFTLGEASTTWPLVTSVSLASGEGLRTQLGQPTKVALQGADYAPQTGTSMATPFVSGVAALLKSADPRLTNAQLRELMERGARDLGAPGRDPVHGHGLVQALESLRLLQNAVR